MSNQTNIMKSEIDFDIPFGLPGFRYAEGNPLFVAFGCVLFEKETTKGYSYRAYNLKTNRSALITRRKNQLDDDDYEKVAAKIRELPIAGPGCIQADRGPGNKLSQEQLAGIMEHVFRELLPDKGYKIREGQIRLADHVLECLCRRNITLAEAEVGVGKTLAYLTAAALVKRGRANDFWFRGRFKGQSWADSARLPIVVSTSSIALQNAILGEYIPALSSILLEGGVIREPLTCVLRKGREHYLCERRLRTFLADADETTQQVLLPLLGRTASIDLADAEQLTPYMKRRINVTGRCDYNCAYRERCRHRWHTKQMKSNAFDFQICNHQLLLADTFHRRDGHTLLIPHYQAVIIDEGHKFLAAARQMYGVELAGTDIFPVTEDIRNLAFKSSEGGAKVCCDAKKLCGQAKRLTKLLLTNKDAEGTDEASDRISVALDATAVRHLRNIRNICAELLTSLAEEQVAPRQTGRRAHILWELEGIGQRAGALEKHGNLICWQEKRGDDVALCAIPNNLDELLHQHFWSKGIPVVLTSGTLSAGGDFSHIKRALGLHRLVPSYLMETTQPSPFDHNINTLLYISKAMPFPDNRSREYLAAIADEIERLLKAAHGHAAVLFTSYKAMDIVREMLEGRNLPYPIFQLNRGKTAAIGQFRESDGGVLLASGALWEGIDIPGDALSLLVIVRLPFAVPDPVSEFEQTLYPSMAAFKDSVVVPDMLVKLKQGAGRLIRTETDTGVIAILDSRAQEGSQYHNRILRALPTCRVTTDIAGVRRFIRSKKNMQYFVRYSHGQT